MPSLSSVSLPLLLALSLAACSSGHDKNAPSDPSAQQPPPEVGIVVAQPTTVPLQEKLVGRLSAYRSADVRARVPGVLQRRVYVEGSDVHQGQVLFQIDPAPLQAALEQARGSLAQAQATYLNAKSAADRARQLLPQQFIAQSDYDNAIAAERSAAAALQAGKAAVDSAQINLGYATVRAPIDGRAGKQQVTEGALVGQGDATLLTTVDQIDPLYANFSIGADDLARIRSLQAQSSEAERNVQILLPDGSAYAQPGVLDFSGDTVDPNTGAVALRARVPNSDHSLLPGTYVSVLATLASVSNAYLVPQQAVQRDAQSAYVLVVGNDGKVARKDVTADQNQGSNWVVTAGLSDRDRIIVSGVQKAQPGQAVKTVAWTPDAPPAAAPKATADANAKQG